MFLGFKNFMKKNIAVIGCGHWGKNLVRNFFEIGVLYAICDPNIEISDLYSKKYNVKSLTFQEIINDTNVQGIVLAVPAPLHASMAIEAMKKRKHVFVEKPLAMNETEALSMIKTAKNYNVKLMVGHLLQYHPVFKAILKLVRNGDIGELNYIYSNRLSFGKVRSKEDVIWSFAPHDISMILSLIGREPKSVSVNSTCILQEKIADKATINLEFEGGLKSHISVSWLNPYKEQKLVVIGKSAMLEFDDTKSWNEKLRFYPFKLDLDHNSPVLKKSNEKYIEVIEEEPLKSECQHFNYVIKENREPLTNAAEGLKVLKVLSAASN